MDKDEKVRYLANICCLLVSDGDIDRMEQELFEEISQEIGAVRLEIQEARELARNEGFRARPQGRWSLRIRNLEDMLLAAYCNGVLEPMEKKTIKGYASQLGITQQQLDVIREETERRCKEYPRAAAGAGSGTGQPGQSHVSSVAAEPPPCFAEVAPSGKGGIFGGIKQLVQRTAAAAAAQRQQQQRQRQQIEQLKLDDPVAARTQWGPAAGGGANFCTRKLVQVSPGRVEFRPSVMGRVFPGAFVLLGVMGLLIGVGVLLFGEAGDRGPGILFSSVGCLFAVIGGVVYWFMTRPIAFDRGARCFWKGGRMPISVADAESRDNAAPLEQIHAIQLISEFVEGSRSSRSSSGTPSYHSYEINLVLKDGLRINVVDHGNLGRIQRDSRQLGEFLGVPVWDDTLRGPFPTELDQPAAGPDAGERTTAPHAAPQGRPADVAMATKRGLVPIWLHLTISITAQIVGALGAAIFVGTWMMRAEGPRLHGPMVMPVLFVAACSLGFLVPRLLLKFLVPAKCPQCGGRAIFHGGGRRRPITYHCKACGHVHVTSVREGRGRRRY